MPTLTLMQADEVLAHANPNPSPQKVAAMVEEVDAARRTNTWFLTDALHEAESLPPALQPFRRLLEGAYTLTLPTRPQKWFSAQVDSNGNPLRSGNGEEDPNARIRIITNNFLLLLNRVKENGKADDGSDDAMALQILDELRYWEDELCRVRTGADELMQSLEFYRGNAPVRIAP